MTEYAHPEVLVSTDWVKERLDDPRIKLVEVDVDTKAYEAGHIKGAVGFNWVTQLQDQRNRDILGKTDFERLMQEAGISNDDTVVVYGDNNNWFAAYGFWLFKVYGHEDVRLMNGGRAKWLAEDDKELVTERPNRPPSDYVAATPDPTIRAMVIEVIQATQDGKRTLVDVRSPDEFTGKIIAPPGMKETAQRAGHIPGAANIPWSTAVAADGTFLPARDLRRIYLDEKGVDPTKPTIAYCRIGERSSHTWFVLKYLLGIDDVKNYDGSWTEYGNLVGVPIEKG